MGRNTKVETWAQDEGAKPGVSSTALTAVKETGNFINRVPGSGAQLSMCLSDVAVEEEVLQDRGQCARLASSKYLPETLTLVLGHEPIHPVRHRQAKHRT